MDTKKMKRFIKNNWIYILFFVLTVLFLYSKMFFDDYKMSFTNTIYEMMPWSTQGVETSGPLLSDVSDNLLSTIYKIFYTDSGFGFWNSSVALGTTEDISSILYPLNVVYLLPLGFAIFFKSLLEFGIGFIGMYLLMKEYGVKKIPSVISGVVYTFSSALVMWHGWPHSDVAVFAPFAFLCIERIIKKVQFKYTIIFSIILCIMLYAGMPTYAAYFLYLLGAYVLIKTLYYYKGDWKKILTIFALFALGVILGVIMSTPYTASLLSSVGSNGYAASRVSQARETLDFDYIRTMFFPYIREGLSLHINESTIYSGIISIFLSMFTFVNYKNKKNIGFWSIAWIIVLILIFTHFLDGIFVLLPAINTSIKYRIIVLLNFIMAILVGININDIIENRKYYNKKRYIYLSISAVCLMAFAYAMYYIRKFNPSIEFKYMIICQGIILFLIITLIFLFIKYNKKFLLILLCAVVIFDMTSFAKEYLPFIQKDSEVIPEATDSIQYLQENTEYERVAAVGAWSMFPNTNVYYGLNDVRSHSFINTYSDIVDYYSEIDENIFASKTRTEITKVNNYNLLRYLGLKYLASKDTGVLDSYNHLNSSSSRGIIGEITSKDTFVQDFKANQDNLCAISVLVGTYQKNIETDDVISFKIIDKATNEVIKEEDILLSNIKDNSNIFIRFPKIADSKDKVYRIEIESTANPQNAITIWSSTEDEYEGQLIKNGEEINQDISLMSFHLNDEINPVYYAKDGMIIGELDDFSNRVELIDTVNILEEDQILDEMKQSYDNSRLYLTNDEMKKVSINKSTFDEVQDDENVEIEKYTDDYIKIKANIKESRFVLLNDYYYKDWKAYIDGKEVEILKGNYLMRTVYVEDEGDHVIEFKYEPQNLYIYIYISIVGLCITVLLFVFRNRVQKLIDKIV